MPADITVFVLPQAEAALAGRIFNPALVVRCQPLCLAQDPMPAFTPDHLPGRGTP